MIVQQRQNNIFSRKRAECLLKNVIWGGLLAYVLFATISMASTDKAQHTLRSLHKVQVVFPTAAHQPYSPIHTSLQVVSQFPQSTQSSRLWTATSPGDSLTIYQVSPPPRLPTTSIAFAMQMTIPSKNTQCFKYTHPFIRLSHAGRQIRSGRHHVTILPDIIPRFPNFDRIFSLNAEASV